MKRLINLSVLFLILAGVVNAQGNFTVTGTASNYTYNSNKLTITGSGEYTISMASSGSSTSDIIEVGNGATVTITLDGINISNSSESPISLSDGSTATIILKGENKVETSATKAGIHVPKGSTLIFSKLSTGSIEAKCTYDNGGSGAGIGGHEGTSTSDPDAVGKIQIDGGKITAIGGTYAAGIGGGDWQAGGNITITGGEVIAKGGKWAAGIGGGSGNCGEGGSYQAYKGSPGTIVITGGIIDATAGDSENHSSSTGIVTPAAIGGGGWGANGSITISGGYITATGSIGGGTASNADGSKPTFSTTYNGTPGNAFIVTTVQINNVKKEGDYSGIFFDGNDNGVVCGNPTIQTDITIPSGKTLTIGDGQTLSIAPGVTLTNEGAIENKGAINNSGTVNNQGTIGNQGTIYVEQGGKLGGTVVTDNGGKVIVYTPPTPPVYYNWYKVSLPATPGLVYVRNDREFESIEIDVVEGSVFSFSIKLLDGFGAPGLQVSTTRNEVITPHESDGRYVIQNINEDIAVYVEGIYPTSNEQVSKDNTRIYMANGVLFIDADRMMEIGIYTSAGTLVYSGKLHSGSNSIQLDRDFYLIKLSNGIRKKIIL